MSNENRIVLYTCKPERRSGQVVRVTPEAMDAINELVEQTDGGYNWKYERNDDLLGFQF